MREILKESQILLEYDRKDLKAFAGTDLANRYLSLRPKLQAPENDLGYWIKKGNLKEFEKFITDWETGKIKSKTQDKKEKRLEGAELVFNDKGWKTYFVTTYPAARQLGSGTTWCITGRYQGVESKGKHYFDQYIKTYKLNGGYYFIFDTLNKDPKTGEYFTALQKYEMEHKTDFLKNIGILFTLTNGFENLEGLIKGKVRKEVKKGLRELEHTLNNTTRTSDGNLKFVSGVDEDPESFIGKGWDLDV